MNRILTRIWWAAAACLAMGSAVAQNEAPPDNLKLGPKAGTPVIKAAKSEARRKAAQSGLAQLAVVQGPVLKTFPYSVVSVRDGNTYSGTIVGSDPRANGARTTSVQTVVIPLRIVMKATALRPLRTFDPTSPDVGCLGGNVTSAMANIVASPIFNAVPNYAINGVSMGNTTFIDAFQRGQFWSDAAGNPVVAAKPAYHLALPTIVKPVQTLTMDNDASSTGIGVSYGFGSDCGSNAASADNPGGRYGFVDINYMDTQLNNFITQLGIDASQFPLFILYRIYMTDGPPQGLGTCCIGGYHSSDFSSPAAPGHTYGIAGYDTGFLIPGWKDISILSHEVLEWVNDPSGNNLVPEWGNIGQVGGCQNNFETGDPLSDGHNHPGILMPNGVTYTPQENAFFSWFLAAGFKGAGGKYSSNGTFSGYAKACSGGIGGGTN